MKLLNREVNENAVANRVLFGTSNRLCKYFNILSVSVNKNKIKNTRVVNKLFNNFIFQSFRNLY